MTAPTRFSIPCLSLALLALASCSILGLREQVGKLEAQGVIAARVTPLPQPGVTTWVAALTEDASGRRETIGLQQVRPDGLAAIQLLADRTYDLAAFTDRNGNRRYDPGEPCAKLRQVRPLPLAGTSGRSVPLALTLRAGRADAPSVSIEVPPENKVLGRGLDLAVGEVAALDDPRFAAEAGGSGLWKSFDFLAENKIGLYFTEPYDPKRVPVVFVYGIGGSPQDWKWMLEHFPRQHHQLWFFHYPSGMRLERVGDTLAGTLGLAASRHGFRECHIVAHSMGGLVSRAAINELAARHPELRVPRFVSVSTPWGGHSAAEAGVRHMKKPVPSWIDMNPGSEFLTQIYLLPLPSGTRHTLVYGRKSSRLPWMKGDNDGTVEVASQIDPRATAGAVQVTELPYEHVEILSQPKTLALIRAGLR